MEISIKNWLAHAGAKMSILSMCAILPACAGQSSSGVSYYSTAENMPFSESVQVGDMLYLSGQIGIDPDTAELAGGGIEAEARQTMENIGDVLARRGLDFTSVVKCSVMLGDMNDWPAFNQVYVEYFEPGRLPARSAFATSGLAFGGKLEVECWAFNPRRQ